MKPARFIVHAYRVGIGVLFIVTYLAVSLGGAVKASPSDNRVITVITTIQAAVDEAQPGDTVFVPPGTYRENVRVTKDNITIRGSQAAELDGTGLAGSTGIRVAPIAPATHISGFVLIGLTIQNYTRNGVFLSRVDNFQISHSNYIDNDAYGIFPVRSSNGLIDSNQVSGSNDTGLYVGQSNDIVLEKNHLTDSTIGINVENCSHVVVRENTVTGNSVGIVIHILPGLSVTDTSDVSVTRNRLFANNRLNPVTNPNDLLSLLPSGFGFVNIGGDRVEARDNIVTHNKTGGLVVTQLPAEVAALDPRINPFPDDNKIAENVVLQNGYDPDPKLGVFHLPSADLLWDFAGTGNCWTDNIFKTSFPSLPVCE